MRIEVYNVFYFWSVFFSIAFVFSRLFNFVILLMVDYGLEEYFLGYIETSACVLSNFFSFVLGLLCSLLVMIFLSGSNAVYDEPVTYEIGVIESVEYNENNFILNDELVIGYGIDLYLTDETSYLETISGFNNFGFQNIQKRLYLNEDDENTCDIMLSLYKRYVSN